MLIQLAFSYIQQKHSHKLSENYTVPRMHYKGKTIQWQRVRAKHAPKIQMMDGDTPVPPPPAAGD